MTQPDHHTAAARPAGLLRRLAAMVYDTLVVVALEMTATLLVLPLAEGDAFASGNNLYRLYVLLIAFTFFGWFWTHGGQTLGMRAWRLRVVAEDGGPIGWTQALLRFVGAALAALPFGVGYLWMYFASDRRTWHDKLSQSYIVYESGRP